MWLATTCFLVKSVYHQGPKVVASGRQIKNYHTTMILVAKAVARVKISPNEQTFFLFFLQVVHVIYHWEAFTSTILMVENMTPNSKKVIYTKPPKFVA